MTTSYEIQEENKEKISGSLETSGEEKCIENPITGAIIGITNLPESTRVNLFQNGFLISGEKFNLPDENIIIIRPGGRLELTKKPKISINIKNIIT